MAGGDRSFEDLLDRGGFERRHLGPDRDERARMLELLGVETIEDLLDVAVPRAIRDETPLDLPPAGDEGAVLARLRELADRNVVRRSLIGAGYHGTITPAVLRRNVLEDPGWYTAYTPYQPEISQGRLEVLLVFQTMVTDLTGCELAGASLLDEGTAAAEAVQLCRRATKRDGTRVLVDPGCHPQTIAVVATRAEPLGLELVHADPRDPEAFATHVAAAPDTVAAVLLQRRTVAGDSSSVIRTTGLLT